MTKLRKHMIEDLQLRGMSDRTQEMYVRSVRQLAKHYNKSPEQITEEELRKYFLYNKNIRKWSRTASTIAICGIKFFFTYTLKRDWTQIPGNIIQRTLPAFEFLRRFLQHVLPKRFIKVRYYGLFASKRKVLLQFVKELLGKMLLTKKKIKKWFQFKCPSCGALMLLVDEFHRRRAPPFSFKTIIPGV